MAAPATLSPGIQVLAFKLQEAGAMHSDVRGKLDSAVRDMHRDNGSYGYYVDHSGDGETGDVVYSSGSKTMRAPYEISKVGDRTATNIDEDEAEEVQPTISYDCIADDDDHYTAMSESFKASRLYTELPLYERFISKAERDALPKEDFAGKGESFPIAKPQDVMAAAHAIGQAGDKNVGASTIRARIIAIAKRKGWTKYLPKTWRGDSTSSSEAATQVTSGNANKTAISLVESAATLETIVIREAKADYEIKLIAPGKGSSAFYPAEVLKRDGPGVFKAGTHVYLNHATAAEEAARPEGDVKNLAGVLTTAAAYNESHAKGPGLYARMKVFADHGQMVEEKAAHVGMSIRASGVAESGKVRDGVPVLKELTSAESVDVVTRAGAGGMILTEAARPDNSQEVDMTEAEVKKLVESAVSTAVTAAVAAVQSPVKALEARALRGDAMVEANRIMSGLSLIEAAKARVIDSVTREGVIPVKDGALDAAAFKTLVMAEAQREGEYLSRITGGASVRGMGVVAPVALTEADIEAQRKREKRERKERERLQESEADVFGDLMGDKRAAQLAVGMREVA